MTEKHAEDSPWLEYLITALVILFFGFLYFALNHGARLWPDFAWPTNNAAQQTVRPAMSGVVPYTGAGQVPEAGNETESASEPEVAVTAAAGQVERGEPLPVPETATEAVTEAPQPADSVDSANSADQEQALQALQAEKAQVEAEKRALESEMAGLRAELEQLKQAPQQDMASDNSGQAGMTPVKQAVLPSAPIAPATPAAQAAAQEAIPSLTLIETTSDFERDLQQALMAGKTEVPLVFDRIEFDPGSANLSHSAEAQVKMTAELLQAYPGQRVILRGHTDNTGTSDANTLLSLMRSESLRRALVDQGVNAERVGIEGVGALEPVASNSTADGRSQNRRIELVIAE